MTPLRLVVLGMMGRSPFGGQTWLYLNWLRGFQRLGHDVWYVEDDTVWPYHPGENAITDDCSYAVRHILLALVLMPICLLGIWIIPELIKSDLHNWRAHEFEDENG